MNLDKLFHLKENHTDVKTEVMAGITTFMTMAYILAVNPNILSASGMDRGSVFTATALSAFIASCLMALLSNYPFVLAPGMGLNAYFTYTVVLGMGEKLSDLEQFYPERMASRILGMGDVMSLIEKAEAALDQDQAAEMQKKLKKMDFDFNDYLTSMEQMTKMGGIGSILNMLPGIGNKAKDLEDMIDEKALDRTKAIILSMTPAERTNPGILNVSRKNRIARGAGVDIAEVNRLVKQIEQSKKLMKQMPGMMGSKMGKRGGFKLPF